LNGLGFALASSTGTREGALSSFRTSVGQRYFGYAPDVSATGRLTRLTPAAFFYFGPFGAFAEYVRSSSQLLSPAATRDVTHNAWDITGSFVLTGETGADRGVRPRASFDPAAGRWGALQLVARYSELTVDRDVFDAGLAAPGASREARQFTIGANWYPVQFIKYYVTFERIAFDGPLAPRDTEKSIVVRAQVAF
jgi:phosphate-selective porin OprO and OprP